MYGWDLRLDPTAQAPVINGAAFHSPAALPVGVYAGVVLNRSAFGLAFGGICADEMALGRGAVGIVRDQLIRVSAGRDECALRPADNGLSLGSWLSGSWGANRRRGIGAERRLVRVGGTGA